MKLLRQNVCYGVGCLEGNNLYSGLRGPGCLCPDSCTGMTGCALASQSSQSCHRSRTGRCTSAPWSSSQAQVCATCRAAMFVTLHQHVQMRMKLSGHTAKRRKMAVVGGWGLTSGVKDAATSAGSSYCNICKRWEVCMRE